MRRRGVNSAWQVERALLDHPAIEEIALVDVRGELGEDEIKTFVREAQGADLPPEVLMQWCPPGGLIFNGPASSTSWAISCAPPAQRIWKMELSREVAGCWDYEASGLASGR